MFHPVVHPPFCIPISFFHDPRIVSHNLCENEREAFKNYLADFWECQSLGKEEFTLLGRKTTSIFLKTNFMIIMFEIII